MRRRFRNVGVLVSLALAMLPAVAQQALRDVHISAIGPRRDLARNASWAGSGAGTLYNNYIFTPAFTNEGICLYITSNDPSATQGFEFAVFGTGDQNVNSFAGNQGAWQNLGPFTGISALASAQNVIQPLSTQAFFYQVSGQAQVVVSLYQSGNSGTTTGTLTMVEGQNSTGCGNITTAPIACPFTTQGQVTTGVPTAIIAASTVPTQAVYICNLTLTSSSAVGGADTVEILAGSGALCATNQRVIFQINPGSGTFLNFTANGQPLIGRFTANGNDLVGNNLCVFQNVGTSVAYSVSFAQF
jgi:hypothetical protein